MFLGSREWSVHRDDNLWLSVTQMSSQCEILNISQPYRPWALLCTKLHVTVNGLEKTEYTDNK
jgi:hypothetical protein